eukprot:14611979-Alexandrium_andersonii.AAC.1
MSSRGFWPWGKGGPPGQAGGNEPEQVSVSSVAGGVDRHVVRHADATIRSCARGCVNHLSATAR